MNEANSRGFSYFIVSYSHIPHLDDHGLELRSPVKPTFQMPRHHDDQDSEIVGWVIFSSVWFNDVK